ncbi:MAG: DUF1460 domain-containing protein [Pseudolabrys sp.]|nr:DUF1460 domain-containing protein [Pseudolabrys sp.]
MKNLCISRRSMLRMLAGGAAFVTTAPAANAETARIARLIEAAQALPTIGQRIDFISRALVGSHYRGYTLIGGPRKAERFVTRDDVFDCVTYCEAVLAAARVRTLDAYAATLRQIRYHDGAVAWRERNHYFAQWCENNIANEICAPVAIPDSETIAKTLSYMPALGARRMSLAAIPRASLLANTQLLATGDIIGFLSERARLDYFHVGFVVVAPDGDLWLRHAARSRGRVLDEPLGRFLSANRVKAVTVLRAREPRNVAGQIGQPYFT